MRPRRILEPDQRPQGTTPGLKNFLPRTGTRYQSHRRPTLSKFQFAISSGPESVRQAGVVESDTFDEAVVLLGEKIPVRTGDSLEIGVSGFPPARYQCVGAIR